jgi:hypothetical protein
VSFFILSIFLPTSSPIFIVHDESVIDKCKGITEMDSKQQNMEINNNVKSPYLHVSEDKSDKLANGEAVKILQVECRTVAKMDVRGSVCDEIEMPKSRVSTKDIIISTETSDKSRVTQTTEIKKEFHEKVINNEEMIKSDSEKMFVEGHTTTVVDGKSHAVMTQSNGESKIIFSITS